MDLLQAKGDPGVARLRKLASGGPAGILLVALCTAALGAAALGAAAGVAPAVEPVVFDEVAAERGIAFVTHSSRSERRYQPETMVAGVALFDYDGDGWLDLYVVNGAPILTLEKNDPKYWNRLYRNEGKGHFVDVTEQAGVAGRGYDVGVVAADYDNDGDRDLFVAGLRRNTLYRNDGDGRFTDVTDAAGLAKPDPKYGTLWAIAGAFFDYDKDGWLDLFVSNYVVWDHASDPVRRPRGPRLLPPGPLPGPAQLPLPQQRRRHVQRRLGGVPASVPTSARAWASASPTSTTTAGATSSSRTTPYRRSCS